MLFRSKGGDLVVARVGHDERLRGHHAGHFAHEFGADVQRFQPCEVIGAVHAHGTLLAMAGIDRVLARPRPRVVVLSVAEEGSDPADVESHLLAAALKADGAQVWRVPLGAGADRELQDAISDQLIRADLVVASGLLDDEARLPRVVSQMGLLDLSSVALQPGGRIGCALVGEDRIPLALVADDPAEAYVGYQYFVRPLVRKLMGVLCVGSKTALTSIPNSAKR